MSNSWSVNKNIKKNIRSFNNPGRDMFAKPFPGLTKILSILLAVIVPVASILLATSIAFRVPDMYNFELSRTAAIKNADINLTNKESGAMGELISSYMRNKTEEFQTTQEYHGDSVPLFTENDQKIMASFKSKLGAINSIAIILLILSILIFVFLYKTRWIRRLRKSYNGALFVYLGMLITLAIVFINKDIKSNFIYKALNISRDEEDILFQLFDSSFITVALIVIFVISILILFFGNAIARYISRESRMFD